MTIKEALSTKTKPLSLSSEELDLALLEAGLIGTADYIPDTDGKAVDLVYAGLLLTSIHVTEQREDDVSIKLAADWKVIYSAIMRKWGMKDPFAVAEPKVRGVRIW